MPIITANNIQLYCEQHGHGDDLILIGGLSADHQVWKSTVRLFSPHFRVTIFDNRGAGQSNSPDYPYTTEMMAQDTIELMNALQIKRAHVVGHSMGGCIAQQIAIISPEKINKCVIACSRAKPNAISNMILSMREKLKSADVSELLLAEYVMPFLFSENFIANEAQVKGFIQWTLQNAHPQTAIGFQNQLHAVMTHDISKKIDQLIAPTLIIAGSDDILMPLQHLETFSKSLKNSQLIVFQNCAHMPHVEYATLFSETVIEFFCRKP